MSSLKCCTLQRRLSHRTLLGTRWLCKICLSYYSMILLTTPAPTVLPPSRIANLRPSSIAIGAISSTSIFILLFILSFVLFFTAFYFGSIFPSDIEFEADKTFLDSENESLILEGNVSLKFDEFLFEAKKVTLDKKNNLFSGESLSFSTLDNFLYGTTN